MSYSLKTPKNIKTKQHKTTQYKIIQYKITNHKPQTNTIHNYITSHDTIECNP